MSASRISAACALLASSYFFRARRYRRPIQIAEKTVRIHISNMLEKLGATDRTQALVLARKAGIIHLDS